MVDTFSATAGISRAVFKVVLIGDKAVGKTSIVKRYIDNTFLEDTESTIGASFFSKVVPITQGNETVAEVKL
jgi:GTPase SAR1 family protein